MACLEPAYWTMILPLKVQENWNTTLINDSNYVFWEQTWEYFKYNDTKTSNFPDDDLVITLNQGFTVNIPKHELVETAKRINQAAGGWIKQPGKALITRMARTAANTHYRSHPNVARYGRVCTRRRTQAPIPWRTVPESGLSRRRL